MNRSRDLQVGIVGLGQMGGNLAHHALEIGMTVTGHTKGAVPPELISAGLLPADTLADMVSRLAPPRFILLYVPAGAVVDDVIASLSAVLEAGDIVADGGNSYWGDSIRRHRALEDQGLHYLDVGTSGGIAGARHGACFMVDRRQ